MTAGSGGPSPRTVAMTDLLSVLPERDLRGPVPTEVHGLTDDSRRVVTGGCFVAVRGLHVDGRGFIPQAVERGARAIVAEPPDPLPGRAVGRILVPDSRWALPRLADAYYGHPSQALTVVGITGTNGKTTTSYLVEALLRARGLATGVIGTIQYLIRGEAREASQTTPDALALQGLLAEMVAATSGLGYMVLSASRFLQTPIVIMGIVVIAAIAYAFDHLVRFVERRVVPWKGRG